MVETKKNVVINFANIRLIDARFLGLLLMLNKMLEGFRCQLIFAGGPAKDRETVSPLWV